ncbi:MULTISPECIES: hypothetical protein [Legionella]|uniref:Uncharacterized protein n=1 Tax=Legionella drozanskii LLAP-1 TaxID=1212489 RepID=A0A0W0TBX3_9GAMM|nr:MULTISPECIES: hypothetical protein [Legionella]KTC93067.1 hypothetical protein Ldro_0438 [Legionella drozanskii LLAP-1]PJE11969.1 MAG: hypothetical protein CK430_08360 [Legionella sp.]
MKTLTREQIIEKILEYIHKEVEPNNQDKNRTLHPDILQAVDEISQVIIKPKNLSFHSENNEERIIAYKVKQYGLHELETAFVDRPSQLEESGEVSSYGFAYR